MIASWSTARAFGMHIPEGSAVSQRGCSKHIVSSWNLLSLVKTYWKREVEIPRVVSLWKEKKRVRYFLQRAAHIHKAKLHLMKENLMKYLSEPSTSPPEWRHSACQILSEQSTDCIAERYISTAFLLTCLQNAVRTRQFSPMHINASNQASTALQFCQLSE